MVRHRSFNPTWMTLFGEPSFVERICREEQEDGYALSHLVPITQYETIAVFVKEDE